MTLASMFLIVSGTLFAGQNSIMGRVQNKTGSAVPGSSVYLDTCEGTLVCVSDLQGNFTFEGLDNGEYQLKAWAPGFGSLVTTLNLKDDARQSCDLALTFREDKVDVSLKITHATAGSDSGIGLNYQVSADLADTETLQEPQILAALKALDCGEYEVVMARPGSAYVGTFVVTACSEGLSISKNVVHTSGMVIEASDYVQAVSNQVIVSMAGQARN